MTNALGEAAAQTNSFTELETGMHFLRNGQWMESEAKIELLADGAAATNGPHTVFFAANLNTIGAVDLTPPDGQRLRSRVYGLAYFDSGNGKAVLLGETQDSLGVLFGDNEVLYTNAFEGIEVDVQYVNKKSGLEQNIVVRAQLPLPSEYGLAPATTRLQVLTEFYDPPVPVKTTSVLADRRSDETLDFGAMTMGHGRAFSVGAAGAAEVSVPVTKQWGMAAGRTFLVEEVPYDLVEEQIKILERNKQGASLIPRRRGEGTNVIAALARVLPQQATTVRGGKMRLAQLETPRRPGLVLDYTLLSSATNFTFQGDTTFYVSGLVNLTGTTTIEGNTVVKFTNSSSAKVSVGGAGLVCQTGPYCPAVFTSKDDNTLGETIPGSTNSPAYTMGETFLEVTAGTNTLQSLRFSYAGVALAQIYGPRSVWHCQFLHCGVAMKADPMASSGIQELHNVLLAQCSLGLMPASGTVVSVQGEQVTADQIGQWWVGGGSPVNTLTNSLLTAIGNLGASLALVNSHQFGSASGVFTNAGAGSYYLVGGSTNRNAGTTNINTALAKALQEKTTYPPLLRTNKETTDVTLARRPIRDTDTPDLGYHYDPIDYLTDIYTVTNATLTVTNGAAIACYNETGIWLQDNSAIVSIGTPLAPNWFVRYQSVQEQSVALGSTSPASGVSVNPAHYGSVGPNGTYRFTKFACPAKGGSHLYYYLTAFAYDTLQVQDCEFWSGANTFGAGSLAVLRNNLFDRSTIEAQGGTSSSLSLSNNLMRGVSMLRFTPSGSNVWYAFNNAFDASTPWTGRSKLTNGYNAYINCTALLSNSVGGDIVLTNFSYASGPLGNYYQASTNLFNASNQPADLAGLYHYTTQTNQVKETNSTVDIGYHCVAVSTNGNPLASYWTTQPDYLADTNGALGTWLMQNFGHLGVDSGDDPDGDWITNLQEYQAGSNPVDTMVVAWGDNADGQCNVSNNLRNVAFLAGGLAHSVVLQSNGMVGAWGNNGDGQTAVPSGLTNAFAIAAGPYHSLALRSDGFIAAWGAYWHGASNSVYVPAGLSNVIAIAAGADHDLALKADGTVAAWGYYYDAPFTEVPTTLTSVRAVAAGYGHSVALLSNGTVVAWGIPAYGVTDVPVGLSNAIAIAMGAYHVLALKTNGTVVAWGAGQTSDGYSWNKGQSIVPTGLSNVVAIAAGGYDSLALRNDGTVVAWGDNSLGQTNVLTGLSNVVAIGSGANHELALRGGRLTPFITQQPADQLAPPGSNVTFNATGIGLAGVRYQWQFNGVNITDATNASLVLSAVTTNSEGSYQVIISTGAGSVASSVASFTLVRPPQITSVSSGLSSTNWITNSLTLGVTATNAGQSLYPISYQWQLNGTNLPGYTTSIYSVFPNPNCEGYYAVVVTNAAGSTNVGVWGIRALFPGTVAAWGTNEAGQLERPADLTNTIATAAGEAHGAAVREDGNVVQWGANWAAIPANLTNALTVAAGARHTLALRTDSTVSAWGTNDLGQTTVPGGLTNVIAVAAGGNQSLALRSNGTVTSWGAPFGTVPADLTNGIAIACGTNFSVAVRGDGTVVTWGNSTNGSAAAPGGLTDVVGIAAGGSHALALKKDGTVVAWESSGVLHSNAPSGLNNVMAVAAGLAHSVALKNDGTVVGWGSNGSGQTDGFTNLPPVKFIAAGANHTLAALFSPLVQYTVDVTKDLLLIYNTNSLDSSNVWSYYMQHRPLLGGANVLPIRCTNTESFLPGEYTNIFVPQIESWLGNNPTKRPQYVVLFLDIPSRVNTNRLPPNGSTDDPGRRPSVSYSLSTQFANWQPFVMHLNMGTTNDCKAYIDKLEYFGTTYSIGKLVISANGTGLYGNTNYVVDDVRHQDYASQTEVSAARDGLLGAGVPSSAILYLTNSESCTGFDSIGRCTNYQAKPHLTNAVDVAGCICWGVHSTLGGDYPTDGKVAWTGTNRWWIIETVESFNGQRATDWGPGAFVEWFSSNAFGTNGSYSNTPVGAVGHVDEPGLGGINDAAKYFGFWASGKNFAIAAWNSRRTPFFQAIGDPLVKK